MFKTVKRELSIIDNVSTTGTIISNVITTQKGVVTGFHFIWTGTPTGTIDVEISIDGTNWITSGIETVGPAGSAGSEFPELLSAAYYMRAKYIHGSGSGNLTVHYSETSR